MLSKNSQELSLAGVLVAGLSHPKPKLLLMPAPHEIQRLVLEINIMQARIWQSLVSTSIRRHRRTDDHCHPAVRFMKRVERQQEDPIVVAGSLLRLQ